MNTLHPDLKNKIQQITILSMKVNNNDRQKLIDMIKHHSEEIEELYQNHNDHWAIETADLIILCFELLMVDRQNIDDIFTQALPRFDKKLNLLLQQRKMT